MGILVFTSSSIIGLSLFAYSAQIKDFNLALLGRALYGIGS